MEKFALRVASKRQVTVPARLLHLLNIKEGDVLELVFDRGALTGRGLKLVPSSFFTDSVLEELNSRQKSLDSGGGINVNNMDQLDARIPRT